MDRLNPLSTEFQTTASKTVQTRANQLRTAKDVQQQAPEQARDSVELTAGQQAEAAARAHKETSGTKKKKGADLIDEATTGDQSEPESEPAVQLPQRNPNEDTPTASLEAATRVVASQMTSRTGPPADLKNVEGTAELQMKPAPLMPIHDIQEAPGPLPPDHPSAAADE